MLRPGDLRSLFPALLLTLALALLGACGDGDDDGFGEAPTPEPPVDPASLCIEEGATQCAGLRWEICTEGRWRLQDECAAPTPSCHATQGCVACLPEQDFCADREIWTCNGDGTGATLSDTCDSGELCLSGDCYDACTIAEQQNSYLGCRFMSVATANVLGPAFGSDFAVVVANPSDVDTATVSVSRGGTLLATDEVEPRQSQAIQLNYVQELQNAASSTRVNGGAFEVTSDIPVAAYQYNPLHFQVLFDNQWEHSFTNDASLLLPEHVLTGEYMVSAWPTWGVGNFPGDAAWTPGFFAIAATEDGTLVEITSSARTQGGTPAAMEPGDNTVVSLDRGDVLQVFSELPPATSETNTCADRGGISGQTNLDVVACLDSTLGDLSGTRLSANRPIAVFAGHVCTFVPFDRWACDHLEEMMFPLETWGVQAVMTAPVAPGQNTIAPARYRVLSSVDDNAISFVPAVQGDVSLDEGEIFEFESAADFVVRGSSPFYVTQTLLGEDALGTNAGDPAMGSGIPLAQWRASYDFLVPDTYDWNHLNVVAPSGTELYLDNVRIDEFFDVPGTDFQVARLRPDPGEHRVESIGGVGFGITSYGYASYTSYLYPGGMNFLRSLPGR